MIGEKSKRAASPEQRSHCSRVQGNNLSLKRVLAWPTNGATSRQKSSCDRGRTAATCHQTGKPEQCVAKLDTIIDLLHALLLVGPSHALVVEQCRSAMPPRLAQDSNTLVRRAYSLTPREGEVLTEMIEGKSNPQIAEELVVSVSTVKCHVSNILSKMGAESRTEAVAMALQGQEVFEELLLATY